MYVEVETAMLACFLPPLVRVAEGGEEREMKAAATARNSERTSTTLHIGTINSSQREKTRKRPWPRNPWTEVEEKK